MEESRIKCCECGEKYPKLTQTIQGCYDIYECGKCGHIWNIGIIRW